MSEHKSFYDQTAEIRRVVKTIQEAVQNVEYLARFAKPEYDLRKCLRSYLSTLRIQVNEIGLRIDTLPFDHGDRS